MHVLLVEDNPADARLTREALREGEVNWKLHWVQDGVEALDFLHARGSHAEAPRPDLILLDLNLPRMDGREMLGRVKNDDRLRRIPVLVLTTSRAEEDVVRCYDLHANCYITKRPVDFDSFVEVVRSIHGFWLSAATLPPHAHG